MLCNPLRHETLLMIDARPYVMRASLHSLCLLEDSLEKRLVAIAQQAAGDGFNKSEYSLIILCGLLGYGYQPHTLPFIQQPVNQWLTPALCQQTRQWLLQAITGTTHKVSNHSLISVLPKTGVDWDAPLVASSNTDSGFDQQTYQQLKQHLRG